MGAESIVKDASGRVVVHTKVGDRQRNYVQTSPVDCRGSAAYQERITIPTPGVLRGQIAVSADITQSPTFTGDHLALGVRVVGYYSGTPFLLAKVVLSALRPSYRLAFGEDGETFDQVGIEAAQIVNGALSSDAAAATVLNLNASGKFWE